MTNDAKENNPFNAMLNSYDKAIAHYEFVIQDLSSVLYDSALQKSKQPVIDFLIEVQRQWKLCREELANQIAKEDSGL